MKVEVANGISFTDEDIINIDDWIPKGEYNPHNVRPFLLHNAGFTSCVVFADCLQDALDKAADEDKLQGFKINKADEVAYDQEDWDSGRISYLGNNCEPYDLESLGVLELLNPPMSFATLYASHLQEKKHED